jgi:hypothetical protein
VVLDARRAVYEELSRRTAEEVGRRCADPRVRAALAAGIRRVLGPDAEIVDDPAGGLIGQRGGRRLDRGATALAARAVARLGPEVEALWNP